jgi:acyl carrier protein
VKVFQEAAFEVSGRKLDTLTLDTKLSELALDSVLVLEVVSQVEQTLGVRFDDEDLSHLTTMRDLGELIAKSRRAA